ncbi:MAG TPA: hypothetical protein PLR05_02145 [Acinetobacter johnsonii]|nr:hypothetical protein [Acinetobacter johnsonii]
MQVCKVLSTANEQGLQTCLEWVELPTLLPPLSYSEATAIGLAFWLTLATVWGIKVIRVQIFEKN